MTVIILSSGIRRCAFWYVYTNVSMETAVSFEPSVICRIRADSHYMSGFRSVAERHRSVKFSHVYINGYVHTDKKVSVKSQFRSFAVAKRECLTGRHGFQPVWEPARFWFWDPWRSPPVWFECLVARNAAWFFFRNGGKINRIGTWMWGNMWHVK
jgi:hypothetical protein